MLKGENIDIIQYDESPEAFVAAALAPAEVYSVTLLEDGKSCRVIAPDNQLSLAIGKEGKNARLAAKLTGYKIDIRPASEMINTSRLKTESGQSLEDFDNDLDDDIDDNFDE